MTLGFIILIGYLIYVLLKPKKATISPQKTTDQSTSPHTEKMNVSSQKKIAKWYGKQDLSNIHGYEIKNALIYCGEKLPDLNGFRNDACLINPQLKISLSGPAELAIEIGYWPSYESISEECRDAYLKWLANGRTNPNINIGYVFLFFYGLERRLFLDGQKQDLSVIERSEIVDEVKKLLDIYGDNDSFRSYATHLLAMEWALNKNHKYAALPDYIDINKIRWHSEAFEIILAHYSANERPLSAQIALQWRLLHPEYFLRTPATRCAKEFQELFIKKYCEKFGEGLVIKPNKERLRATYRSANHSLSNLNLHLPDLPNPFILKSTLNRLNSIIEECTDKLDTYSRFIGNKKNNPKSIVALSLLPKELMVNFSEIRSLSSKLSQICKEGPGLISTKDLYQIFQEGMPERIQKKDAENLSLYMERLGFGLVPDVRIHHIKPTADGQVVIFEKGLEGTLPSREFRTLSVILRLGAIVSQIDNDVSPEEEKILQDLVLKNCELKANEKNALIAFLYWCLRTPQDYNGLNQKLSEVSLTEKTAISHILISIAHADGQIDLREIKELERLYVSLGLDKKQVTSDIHFLASESQPVTLSLKDKEISYSIPKPYEIDKKAQHGFNLNEELIKIREEETRQAKSVLEEIFIDQEPEAIDKKSCLINDPITTDPLSGLDTVHQELFHKLMLQENWKKEQFSQLCKDLGLMVDGAMEVLNEWSYDTVNAPLVEDGETIIYIDINLGEEIQNAK